MLNCVIEIIDVMLRMRIFSRVVSQIEGSSNLCESHELNCVLTVIIFPPFAYICKSWLDGITRSNFTYLSICYKSQLGNPDIHFFA